MWFNSNPIPTATNHNKSERILITLKEEVLPKIKAVVDLVKKQAIVLWSHIQFKAADVITYYGTVWETMKMRISNSNDADMKHDLPSNDVHEELPSTKVIENGTCTKINGDNRYYIIRQHTKRDNEGVLSIFCKHSELSLVCLVLLAILVLSYFFVMIYLNFYLLLL